MLFSEGDDAYDLIVVLEGELDIVRRSWQGTEAPIATYGSGGFLGELSLLTGQRPYLTARTVGPGRVLRVPVESFRRLLDRETDIADLIIAAFIARRRRLEEGEGAHTLELLGSGFSPESAALLHFVRRNRAAAHLDRPRRRRGPAGPARLVGSPSGRRPGGRDPHEGHAPTHPR